MPTEHLSNYLQAKASNEVIKVKKAKIQLQNLKEQYIDKKLSGIHLKQLTADQRGVWPTSAEAIAAHLEGIKNINISDIYPLIEKGIADQLGLLR